MQAARKDKTKRPGYTVHRRSTLWKHIHSWYGKLIHSWYGKLHLKESGQTPVTLTDRENYGMSWPSAISRNVRSATGERSIETPPPHKVNRQQASLSQEPPILTRQVLSEGPTAETLLIAAPFMVPNLHDSVEEISNYMY